jgi:hypothetical protein
MEGRIKGAKGKKIRRDREGGEEVRKDGRVRKGG